jgi:DNA-binding NtrC family response regulator
MTRAWLTVLLIEDDEGINAALTVVLEDEGHRVQPGRAAEDALRG